MQKMVNLVDEKMGNTLLVHLFHKLQRRMGLEPIMVKRDIERPLIQSKALFRMLL